MELVRKFWKFLVAIKDGLVLILLLLFFGGLTLLLSSSPEGAQVTDGALILALDGTISEQPAEIDPLSTLLSGAAPMREYAARDIIHALDKAKSDDRVTMVVLDLDRFIGGGQATLAEVGERLDAVKKSGKPVHAFATIYTNDSYQLASHASQIWVNPQGGVLLAPPGGKGLYFAQALKKFGVTANVYRTGTYKAAVEPYLRDDQSPEAEENEHSLYASIWESWNDEVKAARPSAQIDALIKTPAELVEAAKGNLANMALGQKLVDHITTPVAFAAAMNAALKEEPGDYPLDIAGTHIDDYIMALPIEQSGEAIAVVTVAGAIVDGIGGPGSAAGDTVSEMIYEAAADDTIRALVLRIDSPGGSVLASEQMRVAIQSVKAKGKPVVVSMANVAASGGYWISTPADVIFAEPSTITGSIGVFGVLPTFEGTLGQLGVSTDGAQVAPLSGQPDLFGGTNETFDRVAQAGVEQVYDQFLGLVATSRKKDKAAIDAIAQGRVWSGGQAHQNGLIDRFGGLNDALAEAAKRAKLAEGDYYATYFEQEPSLLGSLLSSGGAIRLWHGGDTRAAMQGRGGDIFTFVRAAHIRQQAAALASLNLLFQGHGVQAMCVTCLPMRPAPTLDPATTSHLGGLLNAQSALSSR